MKRILALFLSLLATPSLCALPLGNPVEPAFLDKGVWFSEPCCNSYYTSIFNDWSLCVGYYGDFVFNRYLQIDGDGLGHGKSIQDTKLNTNAGYLALNLCRRVQLFSTLGGTKMRIRTNETSWREAAGNEGTLFTNTNFSWSVGGRALLLNWRCLNLGIEGQYFRANPTFVRYFSNSFINVPTNLDDAPSMKWAEWQVGGALSYTIRPRCLNVAVVPYVGIKWSKVKFTTDNFTFVLVNSTTSLTIFNLTNERHCGMALGTTFSFGDQVSISWEGRFFDEKALYVNGQICF